MFPLQNSRMNIKQQKQFKSSQVLKSSSNLELYSALTQNVKELRTKKGTDRRCFHDNDSLQ